MNTEVPIIIRGVVPAEWLQLPDAPGFDPYLVADAVFGARLEALKLMGWIRRHEEIGSQWELDDHFDDLTELYAQTCAEMGLPFPPPLSG